MEILNQFGINPLLLAAQIFNFLILLFLLKKFLYGPILKVLETRRIKIEESLKNAEEIELKLAKTEEDRDKVLLNAQNEAQKLMDETQKAVAQIMEDARLKAAADAEDLLKKGQEMIRLERDRMEQELKGEVANIVVAALQKVTGKVITKNDQKELIRKSIGQL